MLEGKCEAGEGGQESFRVAAQDQQAQPQW